MFGFRCWFLFSFSRFPFYSFQFMLTIMIAQMKCAQEKISISFVIWASILSVCQKLCTNLHRNPMSLLLLLLLFLNKPPRALLIVPMNKSDHFSTFRKGDFFVRDFSHILTFISKSSPPAHTARKEFSLSTQFLSDKHVWQSYEQNWIYICYIWYLVELSLCNWPKGTYYGEIWFSMLHR